MPLLTTNIGPDVVPSFQVAAVLSQPSDTVKTRMQADLGGFGT